MKCRSEKHPYHAEGGWAGPAALRRCRLDGRMDGVMKGVLEDDELIPPSADYDPHPLADFNSFSPNLELLDPSPAPRPPPHSHGIKPPIF